MRIEELQDIMSTDNFHDNMEHYLIEEIRRNNPSYTNPFSQNEITLKTVIGAMMKCTVILATLMYLFNRKNE